MTTTDFSSFKELITRKLDKAVELKNELSSSIKGEDGNGTDSTHQRTKTFEDSDTKEENTLLMKKQEDIIAQCNKALQRIDNGTYGKDVHTGQEIPFDRLMANPLAMTNIR
jgi:RNA polymerase-binding transcription factor DksA